MPLPTPEAAEEQEEFISRCMGTQVMQDDFPNQGQRYKVCLTQWEKADLVRTIQEAEIIDLTEKSRRYQMERKTFKFEIKAVDEDTGIFEGYAATFSKVPDSYGDIIEPGAFAKTLAEGGKRIKVLWNHNTMEPIGKPVEMAEDEHGLKVKGKLSLGVQRAREVLSLMKDGVINELSIGYDTITGPMESGIRHLKEVRLWDFSPVTFAANPEAQVTAVKSDTDIIAEAKEITAKLQALVASFDKQPEPPKSTPLSDDDRAAAEMEQALDTITAETEGFDALEAEARIDVLLAELS